VFNELIAFKATVSPSSNFIGFRCVSYSICFSCFKAIKSSLASSCFSWISRSVNEEETGICTWLPPLFFFLLFLPVGSWLLLPPWAPMHLPKKSNLPAQPPLLPLLFFLLFLPVGSWSLLPPWAPIHLPKWSNFPLAQLPLPSPDCASLAGLPSSLPALPALPAIPALPGLPGLPGLPLFLPSLGSGLGSSTSSWVYSTGAYFLLGYCSTSLGSAYVW